MLILRLLLAFPVLVLRSPVAVAQPTPQPHAHAHNDYAHERPLLDALAHGFTSVEADVLLIDDELFVGHDLPSGPHQLPTLREAYLQPLRQRVEQQNGQVYPGYEGPFYLMIDSKTEADATYERLREELVDFQSILSYTQDGHYRPGPVTVFLSGNRPMEALGQDTLQLAGIDGRPEDLGQAYDSTFMPVISQHYRAIVDWDGKQPLSRPQRKTLERLARRAHQEGKKVRLWATPESVLVWETLLSAGIDLINTDQLAELQQFLNKRDK